MSLLPPPEIVRLVESQRVRVFPLAYRTNYQPCIKDNLAQASSDPLQIRKWARDFQNCNWGLATGPESNRLVLDIDAGGENGHARDGMASLNAAIQIHGTAWLETLTARTAGQGLHLHFLWPSGVDRIPSTVSVLGDGIDVRASGGFACLPPATVFLKDQTEAEYTWERGDETTPPAALPDWLLELLLSTQPSSQLPALHGQNGNGKVLQGARNVTLFRRACSLRSQGKEKNEILALCQRENEICYQPPLEDREVLKHVNGAMRYPAGPKVVVALDHSAQPDPPAEFSLIKTLQEYLTATPEKPEWLVSGLVASGTMTNLDAKIKTGKTTLLLAMVKAMLAGETFLGLATTPAGVLYATEQSCSFRSSLERAGLVAGSNLHILSWQDTWGMSWEALLAMIGDFCTKRSDVRAVFIDTVGQFASLSEGGENDSATVNNMMRPLQALLSQRVAVVNSLHSRKSGGEVGESARGSSALGGTADILLTLRRLSANQNKNLRQLESRSRFDETPSELIIELENGCYVVRGTSGAMAQADANRWLLENLPTVVEQALTLEELLDAAAERISRSSLQRALEDPSVVKVGSGRKRDPFRYYREIKVTLGGKFIV